MMPSSNPSVIHVALVGMTGVGKSTLVNVLQGREVATVNNNVRPCTTRAMKYELIDGDAQYCIWDTRGLNEGSEQAPMLNRILKFLRIIPDADRQLKKFLRGSDPRVRLVLLCVDAKKIRIKVHWRIYNKIYAEFCQRRLNVAVVVMQLGEGDVKSSAWKSTCKDTAQGVAEGFPDGRFMEAVPKFEELDNPEVEACKRRILGLISHACRV